MAEVKVRHSIVAYTQYDEDTQTGETTGRHTYGHRGQIINVTNERELALLEREGAVVPADHPLDRPPAGVIHDAAGFVGQENSVAGYKDEELVVWLQMNPVARVTQEANANPQLAKRLLDIEESEDGQGRKTLVNNLQRIVDRDPDNLLTVDDLREDEPEDSAAEDEDDDLDDEEDE